MDERRITRCGRGDRCPKQSHEIDIELGGFRYHPLLNSARASPAIFSISRINLFTLSFQFLLRLASVIPF